MNVCMYVYLFSLKAPAINEFHVTNFKESHISNQFEKQKRNELKDFRRFTYKIYAIAVSVGNEKKRETALNSN